MSHRSHESTGQRQAPGKVFKGKKMAGHMGDKIRTMLNLEIIKSDFENDLLYLKGSIPGSKNTTVILRESVKNITKKTIREKYEAKIKKAYIKKLKREEQLRIQKMERAALRLLQKQEAERIMRKQFREAEEKRKLKEAQKRKEDAEILRQLLNAAGRSRPTTLRRSRTAPSR